MKAYFESPLARRALQEFEQIYKFSLKEFIYLTLINDYDSDEVYRWIDSYKYTRSSPPYEISPVYSIETIDESQNKENRYSFTVETRVNGSQETNTANLASVFLSMGYSLGQYRKFKDVKKVKLYYKHVMLINNANDRRKLVPKLIRMVCESSPETLSMHQGKLYRKISAHFYELQASGQIQTQIDSVHFGLKSVDQLRSFFKSEKAIHSLVSVVHSRCLRSFEILKSTFRRISVRS